jgi:hypothetical protein
MTVGINSLFLFAIGALHINKHGDVVVMTPIQALLNGWISAIFQVT